MIPTGIGGEWCIRIAWAFKEELVPLWWNGSLNASKYYDSSFLSYMQLREQYAWLKVFLRKV